MSLLMKCDILCVTSYWTVFLWACGGRKFSNFKFCFQIWICLWHSFTNQNFNMSFSYIIFNFLKCFVKLFHYFKFLFFVLIWVDCFGLIWAWTWNLFYCPQKGFHVSIWMLPSLEFGWLPNLTYLWFSFMSPNYATRARSLTCITITTPSIVASTTLVTSNH